MQNAFRYQLLLCTLYTKKVKAHVTAKHAYRAVSLWDESRVWDPGD